MYIVYFGVTLYILIYSPIFFDVACDEEAAQVLGRGLVDEGTQNGETVVQTHGATLTDGGARAWLRAGQAHTDHQENSQARH